MASRYTLKCSERMERRKKREVPARAFPDTGHVYKFLVASWRTLFAQRSPSSCQDSCLPMVPEQIQGLAKIMLFLSCGYKVNACLTFAVTGFLSNWKHLKSTETLCKWFFSFHFFFNIPSSLSTTWRITTGL